MHSLLRHALGCHHSLSAVWLIPNLVRLPFLQCQADVGKLLGVCLVNEVSEDQTRVSSEGTPQSSFCATKPEIDCGKISIIVFWDKFYLDLDLIPSQALTMVDFDLGKVFPFMKSFREATIYSRSSRAKAMFGNINGRNKTGHVIQSFGQQQ